MTSSPANLFNIPQPPGLSLGGNDGQQVVALPLNLIAIIISHVSVDRIAAEL